MLKSFSLNKNLKHFFQEHEMCFRFLPEKIHDDFLVSVPSSPFLLSAQGESEQSKPIKFFGKSIENILTQFSTNQNFPWKVNYFIKHPAPSTFLNSNQTFYLQYSCYHSRWVTFVFLCSFPGEMEKNVDDQ